jgi:hypothetical protein
MPYRNDILRLDLVGDVSVNDSTPSSNIAMVFYCSLYYSMLMTLMQKNFLLEAALAFFYYFNTLWNMIQRCCYKTVDFATAASQDGVCITQGKCHKMI